MIDFIKLESLGTPNGFTDHPHLELARKLNLQTAEIIGNKSVAEFAGFKFLLYDSGRLIIQGSLHKYKNGCRGNYDDFRYSELAQAINRISNETGFDWSKLRVTNLEYGVNINPSVPTRQIIEGLLLYKSKEFKDVKNFQSGICKRIDLQRYSLKFYDKRAQHPRVVSKETMRFEIHVRRMEYLAHHGLKVLDDLTNPEILQVLGWDLAQKWSNVVFFDFTGDCNNLEYFQRSNINYWRALRKRHGATNRGRIAKEIKRMNKMQDLLSMGVRREIAELIDAKWYDLMEFETH
jgi:hypothetical protein